MNENQFWMVYIEGHGIRNTKYDTFNGARLEAEELLKKPDYHELKAYILSANCYGTINRPPVVWQSCGAATEEEK